MLPDRVSNPGPLTYDSGALPIALRGPAICEKAGGQGYVSDKVKFLPLACEDWNAPEKLK